MTRRHLASPSASTRSTLARELRDTVIQDLFRTGLTLRGVVPLLNDARATTRVADAIDRLDRTVGHIGRVVFGLHASRATTAD